MPKRQQQKFECSEATSRVKYSGIQFFFSSICIYKSIEGIELPNTTTLSAHTVQSISLIGRQLCVVVHRDDSTTTTRPLTIFKSLMCAYTRQARECCAYITVEKHASHNQLFNCVLPRARKLMMMVVARQVLLDVDT